MAPEALRGRALVLIPMEQSEALPASWPSSLWARGWQPLSTVRPHSQGCATHVLCCCSRAGADRKEGRSEKVLEVEDVEEPNCQEEEELLSAHRVFHLLAVRPLGPAPGPWGRAGPPISMPGLPPPVGLQLEAAQLLGVFYSQTGPLPPAWL